MNKRDFLKSIFGLGMIGIAAKTTGHSNFSSDNSTNDSNDSFVELVPISEATCLTYIYEGTKDQMTTFVNYTNNTKLGVRAHITEWVDSGRVKRTLTVHPTQYSVHYRFQTPEDLALFRESLKPFIQGVTNFKTDLAVKRRILVS